MPLFILLLVPCCFGLILAVTACREAYHKRAERNEEERLLYAMRHFQEWA